MTKWILQRCAVSLEIRAVCSGMVVQSIAETACGLSEICISEFLPWNETLKKKVQTLFDQDHQEMVKSWSEISIICGLSRCSGLACNVRPGRFRIQSGVNCYILHYRIENGGSHYGGYLSAYTSNNRVGEIYISPTRFRNSTPFGIPEKRPFQCS